MLRQSIICHRAILARNARLFQTSSRVDNSAVDAAKAGLKKVDSAVSDTVIKGIDASEAAATKIKETAQAVTGTAQQKSGEASGKASETVGELKGQAKETMGAAKGSVKEKMGEAKAAAKEHGVL